MTSFKDNQNLFYFQNTVERNTKHYTALPLILKIYRTAMIFSGWTIRDILDSSSVRVYYYGQSQIIFNN